MQGKYDGHGELFNFLSKKHPTTQETSIIKTEMIANYMSLATSNYLKDLKGNRGLLDVNFTDENWVSYKGFFKEGRKHGVGKLKLTDGR